MRSAISSLLLAIAFVGAAGCYTCDVCDDCGDEITDAHYGLYKQYQPCCNHGTAAYQNHGTHQMASQSTVGVRR